MQAELQGQRLQGALDRVDSEVRRLLQLEPGQGGRQRAEQLCEGVAQARAIDRLARRGAVVRFAGHEVVQWRGL